MYYSFKGVYIKGDGTKRILLKLFIAHDLEKKNDIKVQQFHSSDNLIDWFTLTLKNETFEKLV